jgi:hypothetical protein
LVDFCFFNFLKQANQAQVQSTNLNLHFRKIKSVTASEAKQPRNFQHKDCGIASSRLAGFATTDWKIFLNP